MSSSPTYETSATRCDNGCGSYATVGCYFGNQPNMDQLNSQEVYNVQVVPSFGPNLGYNALTVGSCARYRNITSAYGPNAENCQTTYNMMACGTCNSSNGNAPVPASMLGRARRQWRK